jgi:branched-chain amino acid transport system ATP-binding protein
MTALFRCTDVSKQYGGVRAVQGVSLSVEAGTIHGLIGPNGAGKSTFIDVVSGRTKGTGRIFLGEEELTHLSPRERRRKGLARSFQRTSIFPGLTSRAQLELAAHGLGRGDLDGLVEMLGLAAVLDDPAGEVSYGQQRLVDLALALVGRPRVLLLDEPAAGLSMGESRSLAVYLRNIATNWKVAVLLVEHDMDVIFKICDVLTVLELGKQIVEGPPAQVRTDPRVITAYFGSAA